LTQLAAKLDHPITQSACNIVARVNARQGMLITRSAAREIGFQYREKIFFKKDKSFIYRMLRSNSANITA
jgi:hypothetical protein